MEQSRKPFSSHAHARSLLAIGDEPVERGLGIEEDLTCNVQIERLEEAGRDRQLRPVLGTVKDVSAATAAKAALGEGG